MPLSGSDLQQVGGYADQVKHKYAVTVVDVSDEVQSGNVYIGIHAGKNKLEAVNLALADADFDDASEPLMGISDPNSDEAIEREASSYDLIVKAVEIS